MAKLSSMNLESSIKDALQRVGLDDAGEILRCSDYLLQQRANLTLKQCRLVHREAGACVLGPVTFVNACDLGAEARLTTGCASLDEALRGGLTTSGIVEVSGAGGCGKTQLCLQLSLTAQWPVQSSGLEAGVLYICTESVFPTRRLQQLIAAFPSPPSRATGSTWSYGDNIYIEHVADVDSLKRCLKQRAPQLMTHRSLRLVIIDSVAGVFRTHLERGAFSRALELRDLAKQLTKLAVRHQAAVICVNQVAEVPSPDGDSREVPALGLSWANLTHTKLRMSRGPEGTRFIEVLSSPDLPSGVKFPFRISNSGLFGS